MEPSRTRIVITVSVFLASVFVVGAASSVKNEPWSQPKFTLKGIKKAFKLTNANDPEVVNAAKFACEQHNKKARSSGDPRARGWEFVSVLKAKSLNIRPHGKKIAMIISANDGPLGDFPQALVEVKRNVQTLIEFKEPPQEYGHDE